MGHRSGSGIGDSSKECVEMSYLRGACGVMRWEGKSIESLNERFNIGTCADGVKCGVVE